MKKLFILILFCIYNLSSFGQDSIKTKTREYYLTLANFSPMTIQLKYKQQIGNKSYFKIGLVNLSTYYDSQHSQNLNYFPVSNSGYSGGLEVGVEFRKQLTKRFTLFHGPNLSFSYNKSISRVLDPSIPQIKQKNISQTYSGAIPYTLGILFNLNSNILIAAEIDPNIKYNYMDNKNGQNNLLNNVSENISVGFDNRIVLLSIVYRL